VLLTITFSLNAAAQTSCPSLNHIFLIHGIGGNAKSFGQMEKYIETVDECYRVHSFEYDTGNSSLSTYEFAASFDQFLSKKILVKEISQFAKLIQ